MKRTLRLIAPMAVALIALTGCGGTKVYDTSKTIVYNGSIYQVTDVQRISTKIDGITQDKQTMSLKNKEKSEIQDLIKANDPLFVRMAFMLDEQELVYRATNVDSWRDYNRMLNDFERAGDDIARLMAEKKTDQQKLR